MCCFRFGIMHKDKVIQDIKFEIHSKFCTSKPFQNHQPYFKRDGKHCDGRFERHPTIVTKCEPKVLYFKNNIIGGGYCVSIGASVCRCITNIPFKS